MEVSFELKFSINGREIDKGIFKVSGENKSVLREAIFMALDKYKAISLDKITTKIDTSRET